MLLFISFAGYKLFIQTTGNINNKIMLVMKNVVRKQDLISNLARGHINKFRTIFIWVINIRKKKMHSDIL